MRRWIPIALGLLAVQVLIAIGLWRYSSIEGMRVQLEASKGAARARAADEKDEEAAPTASSPSLHEALAQSAFWRDPLPPVPRLPGDSLEEQQRAVEAENRLLRQWMERNPVSGLGSFTPSVREALTQLASSDAIVPTLVRVREEVQAEIETFLGTVRMSQYITGLDLDPVLPARIVLKWVDRVEPACGVSHAALHQALSDEAPAEELAHAERARSLDQFVRETIQRMARAQLLLAADHAITQREASGRWPDDRDVQEFLATKLPPHAVLPVSALEEDDNLHLSARSNDDELSLRLD